VLSTVADYTLYELETVAFQEELDLAGVDITFRGITKKCLPEMIRNQLPWQTVGFLPDQKVRVQMHRADFDEFIGIDDAQAQVILDWLIFNIEQIDHGPNDSVVIMHLTIDK